MVTPVRSTILAAALFSIGTAVAVNLNSSESPAERTYVGEATCMQSGCHDGPTGDGSIYAGAAAFRETFHQKIHLRPSPETVRIDRYFDGDSVLTTKYQLGSVEDTLFIHLSKSEDRKDYYAQMWVASGDSTPKMKIAYTYGGNGWIQRFLAEYNGHYYTLPFQYVMPSYRDYSDSGGSFAYLDLTKWAVDDPNVNPPKIRFFDMNSAMFRLQSWDYCASCHVNGLQMKADKLNDTTVYTAMWAGKGVDSASEDINISIGCESCHGPGSEHVAHPTADNIFSPNSRHLPNTFAGTQIKLDVCGQCHNRVVSTNRTFKFPYDDVNNQTYVPGADMLRYISKGNYQTGAQIWADSSAFAHHQQGQDYMRSYGYKKHIYNDGCWSCHTVHYNKKGEDGKVLPFQLNQNWYSLKDGEGCLLCHGTNAASLGLQDLTRDTTWNGRTVNAHTMHSPEIGQCVNCHFSKTATISFVDLPTKPLQDFTSHHFFVIRPNLTRKLKDVFLGAGQINTCAEACHRNGRGSRNFRPEDPVAPDFGIHDRSVGIWFENTDLNLSDSLWMHYLEMYSNILSADREAGPVTGATVITSILPNPVIESTTIRFSLAKAGNISLEVYNTNGELVRELASTRHEAGNYAQDWDATDDLHRPLTSGTYMVRLKTSHGVFSKNVVVVHK
jgi:hypothetical protein